MQIQNPTNSRMRTNPRLYLMAMAATYYFRICGPCWRPFTFPRHALKSETLGPEIQSVCVWACFALKQWRGANIFSADSEPNIRQIKMSANKQTNLIESTAAKSSVGPVLSLFHPVLSVSIYPVPWSWPLYPSAQKGSGPGHLLVVPPSLPLGW